VIPFFIRRGKLGGIEIDLIGGDELCDLVKQLNFEIQTKIVKHITVDAG